MLPARTWLMRVRRLVDDDVDLAGDEIVHRRAGAAIRHVLQLDADEVLEIEPGDMAPEPTPAVPAVAVSGLAFSHAISSFSVFAGTAFLLTTIIGLLGSSATGSRSVTRSYRASRSRR